MAALQRRNDDVCFDVGTTGGGKRGDEGEGESREWRCLRVQYSTKSVLRTSKCLRAVRVTTLVHVLTGNRYTLFLSYSCTKQKTGVRSEGRVSKKVFNGCSFRIE